MSAEVFLFPHAKSTDGEDRGKTAPVVSLAFYRKVGIVATSDGPVCDGCGELIKDGDAFFRVGSEAVYHEGHEPKLNQSVPKKPRLRKALFLIGDRVRFQGNTDMRPGFWKHQGHVCEVVDVVEKVWEDVRVGGRVGRRRVFRKYTLFDTQMKEDRYKVFRCEDGNGAKLTPVKGRKR